MHINSEEKFRSQEIFFWHNIMNMGIGFEYRKQFSW